MWGGCILVFAALQPVVGDYGGYEFDETGGANREGSHACGSRQRSQADNRQAQQAVLYQTTLWSSQVLDGRSGGRVGVSRNWAGGARPLSQLSACRTAIAERDGVQDNFEHSSIHLRRGAGWLSARVDNRELVVACSSSWDLSTFTASSLGRDAHGYPKLLADGNIMFSRKVDLVTQPSGQTLGEVHAAARSEQAVPVHPSSGHAVKTRASVAVTVNALTFADNGLTAGHSGGSDRGRLGLLIKQCRELGVLLVGIQEARQRETAAWQQNGFAVFSTAREENGSCGCMLLVNLDAPVLEGQSHLLEGWGAYT